MSDSLSDRRSQSGISEKQESWAIANTTARCAQYMAALKISRVLTSKRLLFPKFLMDFWVLYRSILRTCAQNWKFVALPFPEIIGVTEKFLAVPRYAHVPFSSQFLNGFCSHGRCEYTCQICVALPLSEIIGGTQKISAVPGYAHAPFSL